MNTIEAKDIASIVESVMSQLQASVPGDSACLGSVPAEV